MLIGLTGRAGSGKDTVAQALRGEFGNLGIVSFADPMRAMLRAMGVPPNYMTDRSLKEQPVPGIGVSYRLLAQSLGTEWGRLIDPDLWLRIAARKIYSAPPGVHIVVPDVRFDNEALLIRSMGGQVWRVNRTVEAVRAHASEAGVSDNLIDLEIDNSGSLDDLCHAVALAGALAGMECANLSLALVA